MNWPHRPSAASVPTHTSICQRAATFIPLSLAVKGRFATSDKPRYHVWPDMDFQRKRKTQTGWEGFEDGRSMRLPVEGTIPRGELRDDFEI